MVNKMTMVLSARAYCSGALIMIHDFNVDIPLIFAVIIHVIIGTCLK
jgi:hypothetical protein